MDRNQAAWRAQRDSLVAVGNSFLPWWVGKVLLKGLERLSSSGDLLWNSPFDLGQKRNPSLAARSHLYKTRC